tara:strand:- start:261 stop:548 length:288 start_codon:yes stop_codon:yes gene_type:complete
MKEEIKFIISSRYFSEILKKSGTDIRSVCIEDEKVHLLTMGNMYELNVELSKNIDIEIWVTDANWPNVSDILSPLPDQPVVVRIRKDEVQLTFIN